jgi:hypothetical protein
MPLDVLCELQRPGRIFHEMFPGAKPSDAWRQRERRAKCPSPAHDLRRTLDHEDLAPTTPTEEPA